MRPEEAEKKYISLLRDIGGNERIKIGAELYETVRNVIEASIRNQNCGISEDELKEKLKERIYK